MKITVELRAVSYITIDVDVDEEDELEDIVYNAVDRYICMNSNPEPDWLVENFWIDD